MSDKKAAVMKASVISVKKESSQKKIDSNQIEGIIIPPFDPTQLADVYSYNGYHTKCIDLKAILTAGLGYEIISSDPDNPDLKPDEEYKKITQFMEAHSDYADQTIIETLVDFQTDQEIYGSAQFEIVRNKKGEIAELYHLPGINIRVVFRNKTESLVQIIGATNIPFNKFGTRFNEVSEYLRMKKYNPRNYFYGRPEYLGALGSILLDRSAVEYNINKFNNNSIPESIISLIGGKMDEKTKKDIHEFFTNKVKGIKNAGRSLLLEIEDGDPDTTQLKVDKLAPDVKDASYRYLRLDARDEIISTHGVPKRLIGIAESGSLGGGSEGQSQFKIFQQCEIDPRQKKLEFLLNNRLLRKGLGVTKWQIKLNKLYVEDPKSDAQFYQIMAIIGVLLPEEIRKELGYPPLTEEQKKTATAMQSAGTGEKLVKTLVDLRKRIESELVYAEE